MFYNISKEFMGGDMNLFPILRKAFFVLLSAVLFSYPVSLQAKLNNSTEYTKLRIEENIKALFSKINKRLNRHAHLVFEVQPPMITSGIRGFDNAQAAKNVIDFVFASIIAKIEFSIASDNREMLITHLQELSAWLEGSGTHRLTAKTMAVLNEIKSADKLSKQACLHYNALKEEITRSTIYLGADELYFNFGLWSQALGLMVRNFGSDKNYDKELMRDVVNYINTAPETRHFLNAFKADSPAKGITSALMTIVSAANKGTHSLDDIRTIDRELADIQRIFNSIS
ncbi:secreted protein [Candidatus Magnetoovum chiemensis]|nr:secreted protein [Candidatus Magnetoovum chiemensis]